jgi:uncharacterized membrane protein YgaE (UPF0421/DUF939 family)
LFFHIFHWFGPRILKTGLAVTIAMLICQFFGIEPTIFAAITAVVNMQSSVNKALMNAWEQIRIHILGIVLATLLGLLLGNNPLVIGLSVILIIGLANRLGWEGISLGIVTIIFVIGAPPDQFLTHAVTRSSAIFIGLAVALSINRWLAPPHYKKLFKENLFSLFHDSSIYFLESIKHFVDSTPLNEYAKAKPKDLTARLDQVIDLYEQAREEFNSKDKARLMERIIEICRGFIERGENIEEMTRQRVKRRQSPDSPLHSVNEVSSEFQRILDILLEGKNKLLTLRDDVEKGLTQHHLGKLTSYEELNWNEFDLAMDQWQRTFSGVYYLRGMMEVAVVATEMRWAAKRMKSIYNLSSVNEMEIKIKKAGES